MRIGALLRPTVDDLSACGGQEPVQPCRRCSGERRTATGDEEWQTGVIVLAAEEYERLCRLDHAAGSAFSQLLLSLPQDDRPFDTPDLHARNVHFEYPVVPSELGKPNRNPGVVA
jgi:hypothetical protein